MEALIALCDNIINLDVRQYWKELFEKNDSLVKYVISLNLYNQLFDQGIDSNGNVIGYYKNITQERFNRNKIAGTHYTLHDTGEFYKSVVVYVSYGELEIRSDNMKDDGSMVEIYGEAILGLNEESKELLIDAIIESDNSKILAEMVLRGIV